MAKKRSDKSPYPSIYSVGSYVSAPQFLGELVCKRAAYKENKELPQQFWALPKWRQFLVWQISLANKLLKTYKAEVIIKALRDPKGRTTYSLGAPHLKGLLEKYAALPEISVKAEIEELEENLGLRKPSNEKKNLRSKLDEV
jgi:hypothetical protein